MATHAGTSKSTSSKKKLPKSISKCNLEKSEALKKKLKRSLLQHRTFGYPHTLGAMTKYNIRLPDLNVLTEDFRSLVRKLLVDDIMVKDLEEACIINYCRTIQTLYPLKTAGDGNCLLHAVSIALWGIHDKALLLRRLVYISLVEDVGARGFRQRWIKERCHLDNSVPDFQLSSGQWSNEWEMVVHAAEDVQRTTTVPGELPFESLEELHIFVLANVIQRPIIVLSDTVVRGLTGSVIGLNNFGGIYLPLLWEPSKCASKTPLVLGYYMGHFTPLVNMKMDNGTLTTSPQRRIIGEYVVPLVNKGLEPLHIHFLTEEEDRNAHELLKKYLKLLEINWTKEDGLHLLLSAKLDHTNIASEYDLMTDYLYTLEREFTNRNKSKGSSERESLDSTSLKHPDLPQQILSLTGPDDNPPQVGIVSNVDRVFQSSQQPAKHEVIGWETERAQHRITTVNTKPVNQRQRKQAMSGVSLCKKRGCMFFGAAEYGGLCYTCFIESTREPERSSNEAEVFEYQPSVADTECAHLGCTNMASVNTLPYCHEHVHRRQPMGSGGGQQSSPFSYVPSYTDYKCKHRGCNNVASVHTTPYCHEHVHEDRVIMRSQPETPTRIPETELSVTSDQCSYPGCIFAASRNTYPFCYEHYTPCEEPCEEQAQSLYTVGPRQPEQRPDPQPYEPSISIHVCTYEGCNNMASLKTFPFCHEHHVQRMPQKGPAAYKRGNSLSQYEAFASWERLDDETDETKCHSVGSFSPGESRKCKVANCPLFCPPCTNYCAQHLAWKQAQHTAKGQGPRDSVCSNICRKPDCQTPANASCAGLCKSCFLDDSLSGDDNTDSLGEDIHQAEEATISSTDEGPMGHKTEEPHVSKVDPTSPPAAVKAPATGPNQTPLASSSCVSPICHNEGDPSLNGLCKDCFGILKNKSVSKRRPLSRDPAIHDDSEGSLPTLASVLPCVTEGCNMYGTAKQNFFCSKCHMAWLKDGGLHHISNGVIQKEPKGGDSAPTNVYDVKRSDTASPCCSHRSESPILDILYANTNTLGKFSPRQRHKTVVPYNGLTDSRQTELPPSDIQINNQVSTMNDDEEAGEGLLALRKLENSARASRRKCKSTRCKNFGNPMRKGYCNTCVIR